MSLWLIGCGFHAQEYARVLDNLQVDYKVIGRGTKSADKFSDRLNKEVFCGGINKALNELDPPKKAIVSVNIEELANSTILLAKTGAKDILLEKPGGITIDEIKSISDIAIKEKSNVMVAFNRRFYASTRKAKKIIDEDGGSVSCKFEFTEWSHIVEKKPYPLEVKERWLYANSSHVIDLVFHLCGVPKDWKCWRMGGLDWHKSGARFAGAGITSKDVLFSYFADWGGPGRWSVEILTKKHRLIFSPMEKLQVLKIGELNPTHLKISDEIDLEFKPGLYHQVRSFLDGDYTNLPNIAEHLNNMKFYSEIAGYK